MLILSRKTKGIRNKMTKTIENFLQYVKIDTQSCETAGVTPSSAKQRDLAKL